MKTNHFVSALHVAMIASVVALPFAPLASAAVLSVLGMLSIFTADYRRTAGPRGAAVSATGVADVIAFVPDRSNERVLARAA